MVPKESSHIWNHEIIMSANGLSIVVNAVYSLLFFISIAYLPPEYKPMAAGLPLLPHTIYN
jgi:hypothetical protein